jgi:hypothetical protein
MMPEQSVVGAAWLMLGFNLNALHWMLPNEPERELLPVWRNYFRSIT